MRDKQKKSAYAALLVICLCLQGCWARGDTATQEFLLYVDRIAGYAESSIDAVKALYDEGKLTNKQAQSAKDAIDRIQKANKLAFEAGLAGADLTKRVEITSAKRSVIEAKIAGMKSDLMALSENTNGMSRISVIAAPMMEFLNNASSSLTRFKLKGSGASTFDISEITALKIKQQALRLAATEREVTSWILN